MRPHLLYQTWLDLDHVLAIGPSEIDTARGQGGYVAITFAFREDTRFLLGRWDNRPLPECRSAMEKAYDELLQAWKAKP